MRFTYDRSPDTLFVDVHGEALPAASIPLDRGDRDYLYLRIDPETDAVVGIQIEHFLSSAAHRHPELVGALELVNLVVIDREGLRQITYIVSARTEANRASILIADLFRLSA